MDTLKLLKQEAHHNEVTAKLKLVETKLFPGYDVIIAGGSVRKAMFDLPMDKSDIDIFFKSADELKRAIAHLQECGVPVSKHPNCTGATITNKHDVGFDVPEGGMYIQLIHKDMYPTIESLFDNFDFTICQFAYKDGQFIYTQESLRDSIRCAISANPKYSKPIAAVRIHKYLSAGFSPDFALFKRFFTTERDTISSDTAEIGEYEELYGAF